MAFEVKRLKNHIDDSKNNVYLITELNKKWLVGWLEEEVHHYEAKKKPVVEHDTWNNCDWCWLFCEPVDEVRFNHSS